MAKAKKVQSREAELENALKTLVEACAHVNIGALNGTTVKDMRNVLAFLAACDAAVEALGSKQ